LTDLDDVATGFDAPKWTGLGEERGRVLWLRCMCECDIIIASAGSDAALDAVLVGMPGTSAGGGIAR